MSRRPPNPAAERAAANSITIKSLLKLEGNKTCADCKRNKHPRWASWNLGIFVCIRCSGIHRGMGTHISRVKSVDLDAWTDEQLQSVLKWGNTRANKYWEDGLAEGHVPSEAKIENFIRTKYESKRWVMKGPIPDPATLDADGDDDIPLNLVKEKQSLERSSSQKAPPTQNGRSNITRAPQPDMFGDDVSPPKAKASPAPPAPPKQTKPADSLLGLDFFGSEAAPPSRPASVTPTPGTQSRPDLKQSILSLYASAPRPQAQQQPSHQSSGSFGGMQSAPQQSPQQPSFGGMNDAFGNMNFSSTPSSPPAQPKASAFSGLGNLSNRATPSQTSPPALSGGSFFDVKPAQKSAPAPPQASRAFSSSSGFGDFGSAPGVTPAPVASSSSGLGDLFDFTTPAATTVPPKQTVVSPTQSAFNLSQPSIQAQTQPPVATTNAWSNNDTWGSGNAWGNSGSNSPEISKAAPPQASTGDFGWGSALSTQSIVVGGEATGFSPTTAAPPKVSADDDFGGWSSAAPASTNATPAKPATGFSGSDDLFSNVWG